MKNIFRMSVIAVFALFMISIGGLADYTKKDFLTTAVACAASTTLVNGTDFTSVEYFINDVSVGTNTTNIPTTTGRECGVVLSILKSAGTTSRTLSVDWTWVHIGLTTSR